MKHYRIGEHAKFPGGIPDFLKHYEDMGIIHSERSESGYRYYSFRTMLMPGDWKQKLGCQYGYYAVPLEE